MLILTGKAREWTGITPTADRFVQSPAYERISMTDKQQALEFLRGLDEPLIQIRITDALGVRLDGSVIPNVDLFNKVTLHVAEDRASEVARREFIMQLPRIIRQEHPHWKLFRVRLDLFGQMKLTFCHLPTGEVCGVVLENRADGVDFLYQVQFLVKGMQGGPDLLYEATYSLASVDEDNEESFAVKPEFLMAALGK